MSAWVWGKVEVFERVTGALAVRLEGDLVVAFVTLVALETFDALEEEDDGEDEDADLLLGWFLRGCRPRFVAFFLIMIDLKAAVAVDESYICSQFCVEDEQVVSDRQQKAALFLSRFFQE